LRVGEPVLVVPAFSPSHSRPGLSLIALLVLGLAITFVFTKIHMSEYERERGRKQKWSGYWFNHTDKINALFG